MCKDWWKLLGLYLYLMIAMCHPYRHDRKSREITLAQVLMDVVMNIFLNLSLKLTRKTIFTWNIVLEFISHSCIMNARNTSLVRSAFRFHDRLTHPSWKEMLIHEQFFSKANWFNTYETTLADMVRDWIVVLGKINM